MKQRAPDIAFFPKDISLKKSENENEYRFSPFLILICEVQFKGKKRIFIGKKSTKQTWLLLQVLVEIKFSAKFLSKTSS